MKCSDGARAVRNLHKVCFSVRKVSFLNMLILSRTA